MTDENPLEGMVCDLCDERIDGTEDDPVSSFVAEGNGVPERGVSDEEVLEAIIEALEVGGSEIQMRAAQTIREKGEIIAHGECMDEMNIFWDEDALDDSTDDASYAEQEADA